MLVLEVGFSIVASDPVSIGCGVTETLSTLDLSMEVVIHPLEQTFPQVHVTYGVDALREDYTSGHLAIPVAPVMLNAFHVPLVHKHNDLLIGRLIYLLEDVFISLINEYLLDLGEEDVCGLDVPVDQVLVQALLSECLGTRHSQLLSVALQLVNPGGKIVLPSLHYVLGNVEPGLMIKSLPTGSVHLRPQEV
jgi:hypothetical protein